MMFSLTQCHKIYYSSLTQERRLSSRLSCVAIHFTILNPVSGLSPHSLVDFRFDQAVVTVFPAIDHINLIRIRIGKNIKAMIKEVHLLMALPVHRFKGKTFCPDQPLNISFRTLGRHSGNAR